MTRRYLSPLYLRIEDIPEYATLSAADRARVDALGAPLRAASQTADLIDRDAVWTAKREALGIIRAAGLSGARQAELDAFRARGAEALKDWATWCAIAEVHGPDWRAWPAALADPRSAEVAAFRRERADRAGFHAWLQWLAAEQAAAAQRAAREAGMEIGVIADLAVGAHPGGADAWARQDVIVTGVSVGAPPDEFNQRGQDWTLPPWHPGRLVAQAGRPLAELVAATTRHAGGLRIDHVMGLARLWWIPAGMEPGQGTYVRYDHELIGDVLCGGRRASRRWSSGRISARSSPGCASSWPTAGSSAPRWHGSSGARTARRAARAGGAAAAWPRSAPTTCLRPRRSSPASRSASGPSSGC